jgi:hypothetical protein
MSYLSAFNTQLINFFDELCTTFPEEKEIKWATEGIKGAKKVNPRLVLDLFVEHVYKDCSEAIATKNGNLMREIAQQKFKSQFNEMNSALSIFDKHWDTMGSKNQSVIWQYLTVLCQLSEKASISQV